MGRVLHVPIGVWRPQAPCREVLQETLELLKTVRFVTPLEAQAAAAQIKKIEQVLTDTQRPT